MLVGPEVGEIFLDWRSGGLIGKPQPEMLLVDYGCNMFSLDFVVDYGWFWWFWVISVSNPNPSWSSLWEVYSFCFYLAPCNITVRRSISIRQLCQKAFWADRREGCCNCIHSYPSALWPCKHIIIKKYQVLSSHIILIIFNSMDLVCLWSHCFILNPIYPGAHCLTEAQVQTPNPSQCEGWWDADAYGWCSW